MIHAVIHKGGGWAPFPNDQKDFIAVLDLLKAHDTQLWVDTYANVSKYVKLRESVKFQWVEPDRSFQYVTDLDTSVYDLPLSVMVSKDNVVREMQIKPNTVSTID